MVHSPHPECRDDPTATRADGLGLYDALGSEIKRYVEIANASHFVSLERNAPQLLAEVQLFLDGAVNGTR